MIQENHDEFEINDVALNVSALAKTITAKIVNIDAFGMIDINFNCEMLIPFNLEKLRDNNAFKFDLTMHDNSVSGFQ